MNETWDVIVVGAGAAGATAAWRAASVGAKVLALEKTSRFGTKILISGGGKCNVTHAGEVNDVLGGFRPTEARFLRPSMHRFSNQAILALLKERGLRFQTRPNGRVFPVDATAKDVVAVLEAILQDAGVEIRYRSPVTGLWVEEGAVWGVETPNGRLAAKSVVVCVGGCSYPASGTTGDGWAWAAANGHTVRKPHAALAPIHLTPESLRREWSGVALRDCVLKAHQAGRELVRWRDDVLFAHFGVSGPAALEISRSIAEAAGGGRVSLFVDLLPDATSEDINRMCTEWATAHPRKGWSVFLKAFAPETVHAAILEHAASGSHTAGSTPRKERLRLAETLKAWPIGAVHDTPIEKGEVVAGGVALDEVDGNTMASSKVVGLFFAGEVLDIAGRVGGYNLQAAWSTGYVAGEGAARNALRNA